LVKSVEDELGGIDTLIYHAEVQPRESLLDMDEWDWHRVLDVNLTGAFLMLQSVGGDAGKKAGSDHPPYSKSGSEPGKGRGGLSIQQGRLSRVI